MTDPHGPRQHLAWPTPLTSFVGRDHDIAQVCAILRRQAMRLVTLTGPGGVGKTRLAIAVMDDLTNDVGDGVIFVELAPIRAPELVASAIAQAYGVRETSPGSMLDALVAAIGHAEVLLVLDNFEHVAAAAPLVSQLLRACPKLKVLTTSRAPLHVSGEHEYPVLPLPLPDSNATVSEQVTMAPAVRLFVERALAVDPGFALTDDNAGAVAAICVRLDGLPLAIELAAARSKLFPPAQLLPRLAQRLPLLTGGPRDVPARLQTMYDAIRWSYDLLTPEEQVLFRRLAAFTGGFTVDAVDGMMAAYRANAHAHPPGGDELHFATPDTLDAIASLIDNSLLQWIDRQGNRGRLGMLETIREFALEQLAEAGETESARAAHAAYWVARDGDLDPNVIAPGERLDDRLWRIEAEYADLLSALAWLKENDDAQGVLRLAGALAIFWHHRGRLDEAREWLTWALDHTTEHPTATRARALAGLSLVVWSQGHADHAATLADASQDVATIVGDLELVALAIHLRGIAALNQGELDLAQRLMEQTYRLQRDLGLPTQGAVARLVLSEIAVQTGDIDAGVRGAEYALARFRAIGDLTGAANALGLLARVAHDRGDDHAAIQAYQDALRLWLETDTRWAATGVQSASTERSGFPRWANIDDRRLLFCALSELAAFAAACNQPEQAARLLGAASRRRDAVVAHVRPSVLAHLEQTRTALCDALGDRRWTALVTAGEALRLADAVALAMTIAGPEPTHDRSTGHSPGQRAGLSSRQLDVLRLMVAGRSDREIATELFIAHRTAEDHVSNIIAKLSVPNRTAAAAKAVRDGLV